MKELLSRKYLISFFYIIVCIAGVITWRNIHIENTPELNLPSMTVNYSWGSTVPEIMEQEITRKVESAASNLRDVTEINSITQEGRSSVTIKFNKNAPVDFRSLELREYLNLLEDDLPSEVSPVSITRSVPEELEDQQTFMVYTLSGEYEPRKLLDYVRQTIKPQLLGLEGLSEVKDQGVDDPALMIEFDRFKLEKYNLSPRTLMMQVRERLNWRSSGYTENGGSRYSMVIPPQYSSTTDIGNMKIALPGALKQINLSEIANVKVTDFPAKSKRRINGSPALTIEFVKESGADAMTLARDIINTMEEIRSTLPEGMKLRLQVDSTEILRDQFDQLALQAMISAVLVFLVVFVFIRKLRAPFVIAGSVLFSILMSLITLYLFNYTLNVITLAGLTIAFGMLIDNAVVVFEQVNPGLPSDREERLEHVRKELPKSVVPVLGSTFTTVGIFLPLLFAVEELRLFLMPLAVALTITLICSVIIAFTWIPYSLIWLSPTGNKDSEKKRSRKKWFRPRTILKLLVWRRKLRWVLLLGVIAAVGLPLFLIEEPLWEEETWWPEFTRVYFDNRDVIDPWIGGITYRFVNDTYFGNPWRRNNQEFISVNIYSPQGTPLSEIDKIVASYEKIAKPYEHAFSYYEARMSEYYGANIRFAVDPDFNFKRDPYMFYGEAQFLAARTGNVAISVQGLNIPGISTGFGGSSSSYSIRLSGYSYDELYELAREIERRLVKNRRVREVDVNSTSFYSRTDFHQYVLELDNEKILSRGLNRAELIQGLSLDLNPQNSFGKVEFGGQEMYLMARNEADDFYEEDLMENIRETNTSSFDLASFGTIKKEKALTEIRRRDQSYFRTVTLDFLGNYRMGRDFIEKTLETVPVPVGAKIDFGSYSFNFGDEEQSKNLWLIALLSILSVWMIVSALLESWSGPLFVILAIPFCGLGIMVGTLGNDLAFDRGAIAGALLGIGVVVNNAILLTHQKQLEYSKGIRGLRCWYYVFKKKMRTIIITTTTTVFGLLPMLLIGTNEFWESLSVIVVWGLMFSTVLVILFAGLWSKK